MCISLPGQSDHIHPEFCKVFFIEYAVSQDAYIKCNLLDLPYPHINWNVRIGGKSVMGIDSKIWNESTTYIILNKTFFIV